MRRFVDASTDTDISAFGRERALEQALDTLRETLKDTEERLHSMRLQHESLAVAHRELRDQHADQRADGDRLSRDVGQLHECAAALRAEVQAVRADREEAVRLQLQLQQELDDAKAQRDAAQQRREGDARTVQDLQRQCREMERILMRKHPDSVSALIGEMNIGGCDDWCNI